MVPSSAGEVVLVPFPFSDLSRTKLRPTVCLADAGRGDWVLCRVRSNSYRNPAAVPLDGAYFVSGGLPIASFARPGKRFTANAALLARSVGLLSDSGLGRVLDAVITLLRPPTGP